jgi:hypothetical protein
MFSRAKHPAQQGVFFLGEKRVGSERGEDARRNMVKSTPREHWDGWEQFLAKFVDRFSSRNSSLELHF